MLTKSDIQAEKLKKKRYHEPKFTPFTTLESFLYLKNKQIVVLYIYKLFIIQ